MQAFHGLQTFSIYSTVKLPGTDDDRVPGRFGAGSLIQWKTLSNKENILFRRRSAGLPALRGLTYYNGKRIKCRYGLYVLLYGVSGAFCLHLPRILL